MLEIKHVSKQYGRQPVLRDISLNIAPGECVSLIGESGSGKSTLARLILALEKPTGGSICWKGNPVAARRGRALYRDIQPVFQDHSGCFNPRRKLMDSLCEPMENMLTLSGAERNKRMIRLLDMVELPTTLANRYPQELSGGQRRRACIARAISVQPSLIVLDEAVAGLDATVMIKILDLLKSLQKETGCAYLFITHVMGAALYMSPQIAVLQEGRIVERNGAMTAVSTFTHPVSKTETGFHSILSGGNQ